MDALFAIQVEPLQVLGSGRTHLVVKRAAQLHDDGVGPQGPVRELGTRIAGLAQKRAIQEADRPFVQQSRDFDRRCALDGVDRIGACSFV